MGDRVCTLAPCSRSNCSWGMARIARHCSAWLRWDIHRIALPQRLRLNLLNLCIVEQPLLKTVHVCIGGTKLKHTWRTRSTRILQRIQICPGSTQPTAQRTSVHYAPRALAVQKRSAAYAQCLEIKRTRRALRECPNNLHGLVARGIRVARAPNAVNLP